MQRTVQLGIRHGGSFGSELLLMLRAGRLEFSRRSGGQTLATRIISVSYLPYRLAQTDMLSALGRA